MVLHQALVAIGDLSDPVSLEASDHHADASALFGEADGDPYPGRYTAAVELEAKGNGEDSNLKVGPAGKIVGRIRGYFSRPKGDNVAAA